MTPAKGKVNYNNGEVTDFEVSTINQKVQIDTTLTIEHGPDMYSPVHINQDGVDKTIQAGEAKVIRLEDCVIEIAHFERPERF